MQKNKNKDYYILPYILLKVYGLGSFALLNSLTEWKPEITVYDEPFSKRSTVTLLSGNRRKPILVESDLLLQIVDPINIIYDEIYKREDKFALVGLGLVIAIMPQLAGADMLPSELMQKICLKDFSDTVTAQKIVFEFLRTYMGLTKAGIYQEI